MSKPKARADKTDKTERTVAPLVLKAPAAKTPAAKAMTGNQYRDLIASYIHHN